MPPERSPDSPTPHLYVALDLSLVKWQAAASAREGRVIGRRLVPGDAAGLVAWLDRAKADLGLPATAPVRSCYEAGRDAFWVHRFLERLGIEDVVVDPASLRVSRRKRRVKTDRRDAQLLLMDLVLCHAGQKDVWSVVRIPSEEAEDDRRLHRCHERVKKERAQHRTRIFSLLATQGVYPDRLDRVLEQLEDLRTWHDQPLPVGLRIEIERERARLAMAQAQIREIEKEQRVRATLQSPQMKKVRVLASLRGIGIDTAWLLVMEFFGWREFANRREVASAAGLGGSAFSSGSDDREQGVSKAGNARVRHRMVEIAWLWLRFQPHSRLTQWFRAKFASGGARQRRVGIVAVARRLLIELWHFVEHDVVPPGAKVHINP